MGKRRVGERRVAGGSGDLGRLGVAPDADAGGVRDAEGRGDGAGATDHQSAVLSRQLDHLPEVDVDLPRGDEEAGGASCHPGLEQHVRPQLREPVLSIVRSLRIGVDHHLTRLPLAGGGHVIGSGIGSGHQFLLGLGPRIVNI